MDFGKELVAVDRAVALVAGVALLSFIVLIGWALDLSWLTSLWGPVPMVPTTAVCVLVMAGVEWLRQMAQRKHASCWIDAVAAGLTTTVVVGALVTLFDGPSLGVWLWHVPSSTHLPDARMADSTAAGLLILCVAQWVTRTGRLIAAGALWMIVLLMWFLPASMGVNWMSWPTMIALLGLSAANRLGAEKA